MKTSGVSCETKFGLLGFLGHPNEHISHLEMDAKAVESTNKFSKVIRNHETSDKNGL